jgi:hypothetical protein
MSCGCSIASGVKVRRRVGAPPLHTISNFEAFAQSLGLRTEMLKRFVFGAILLALLDGPSLGVNHPLERFANQGG